MTTQSLRTSFPVTVAGTLLALMCGPVLSNQVAWYRMGAADNGARQVRDTISGEIDGVFVGDSTVGSTDRPQISDNGVTITNSGSVVIGDTPFEGVAMTGIDFLFHSDGPAGAGNATLEFIAKTPAPEFAAAIWSNTIYDGVTNTITGHPDADRFHLHQTFFGSHGFNADMRTPGAGGPYDINGIGGFFADEWVAIAIVREHQGGDNYLWRWFIEGDEVTSKSTDVPLPTNSNIWSIGSRGCCAANLVVDELRFWDEALVHQDPRFLRVVAQSEPDIPVPGDYNANGVVDAADYVEWRSTFGDTVSPGTGADGDNDGMIGHGDYNFWRMNFGNSLDGSGAALGAAVPEPNTFLMLLISVVGFGLATRRIGDI